MQKFTYRILLNEDWGLEDLYEFPHALSQCYSFIYCLDGELEPRNRERINLALQEYPWGGGYSYVNIYTVLNHQVPHLDRPKIVSIQKASPGWLDLLLNQNVAIQLAASVTTLIGAGTAALAAYKKGQKLLSDIQEQRIKAKVRQLELDAFQLKAMNTIATETAKNLGYRNLKALHQHTGDPEVSLKLLQAHYRRMSVLADYSNKGKATFTTPDIATHD
ncbi:MAG: hypothetical protein HY014_05000 [Acidobacteria bacterium]|nr:hypothetical protein [Acidobacteriota bacterium]MBI3487510.1 hypothetical protein [Acidobacteriota bacterium]